MMSSRFFLSQEDQEDDDINQFQTKSGESFDFKQGYDTAVFEVYKQYKLRSRTVNVTQPEKTKDNQHPKMLKEKITFAKPTDKSDLTSNEVTVEDVTKTFPPSQQPLITPPLKHNPSDIPQKMRKNDKPQDETENQEETSKKSADKERAVNQNAKIQFEKPFDLEAEIGKLKIAIPLLELAKHDIYKQQIKKFLQLTHNKDDVNVLDDTPELLFGPEVDGKTISTRVLPFYISLHIHDKIFHNAMFDSGASHNLMPKSVMERLNLDITRPYKDLYSFDSSQVKCLGLIKYLCVSLVQYPNKSILMDVVVADIPPKYGMLLSRSWGAKLQGSLQLDMSYATISIFGKTKRLYRETLMKYMVSSEEKPQNFPIYAVHSDIDSFILFNDDTGHIDDDKSFTLEQNIHTAELINTQGPEIKQSIDETIPEDKPDKKQDLQLLIPNPSEVAEPALNQEILWFLEFDGLVNKLGAGAGVWIHNKQNSHAEGQAYRLNFRCTNNMAEYEALLLGLKLIKSLQATKVSILGDSDLIIQQMKGNFVTNDKRLRSYRSTAIEILNAFAEFQLTKISRTHNLHAHSLATFSSTCKLPFEPNHCFTAEIKHRPSIPNNVKDGQVFEDDTQINNFLTLQQEFSGLNIDADVMKDSQPPSEQDQITISAKTENQILHPTTFDDKNVQELKQINMDEIAGEDDEVIQLKDNFLPTGLTPLEYIFDSNDIPRKPKMQPLNAAIEECNIGTLEKPKIIKLSKSLPPDQKPKYVDLFKEFQDVFAWSYEDLKSYDTSVIQHTIPLKPNQKPFK